MQAPYGRTGRLTPPFINIFLSDLFLFFDDIDIANYVDDNTPYFFFSIHNIKITKCGTSQNSSYLAVEHPTRKALNTEEEK